jgi:hypothetical protein
MLKIKFNQVAPQQLDADIFHSSLEFLSPTPATPKLSYQATFTAQGY